MMIWHAAPFQVPRLSPTCEPAAPIAVSWAGTAPVVALANGCVRAPLTPTVSVKVSVTATGAGADGLVGRLLLPQPATATRALSTPSHGNARRIVCRTIGEVLVIRK